MLKRILYFIFLYFSVLVLSAVHSNTFADEGIQVSVDGQDFDTKDFFDLEGLGFEKDKVNFNKGWLGIFMENAEGKGILVREITRGSPAAEAGLRVGDIITKVNDVPATGRGELNLIQFKKTIEALGAGGTPALTVSRDTTEIVFYPRLFAKLLKNVTEPITPFIPKASHGLTKEDKNTPPSQGRDGEVENLSPGEERKIPPRSEHKGTSFIECAIKNERYRDMLGATLQRIGEEIYVREGFQSNDEANPFRLSVVNYFMLHPFDIPKIGQDIVDALCKKDACAQIGCAAVLLDVKLNTQNFEPETFSSFPSAAGAGGKVFLPTAPLSPPCEGEERGVVDESPRIPLHTEQLQKRETTGLQGRLQGVVDRLPSIVSLIKEAFRDLSRDEAEFLCQNAHKVWSPNEKIEPKDLARVLALSQKVDLVKLFHAISLLLSQLTLFTYEQGIAGQEKTHPKAMQTKVLPFRLPASLQGAHQPEIPDEAAMHLKLAEDIGGTRGRETDDVSTDSTPSPGGRGLGGGGTGASQDFAGDILFVQDTSIGKIVVGGKGTSYYYADAAVIIDLGGNDCYFNNAGSSRKDIPVSLCIDLSGDDIYHTDAPFSQGTGSFGIGILIDYRGNDQYVGKDYSQGTCLFGVGLLLDSDGNDIYFSRQFAQGVGFTKGFGALIDAQGNDYYFTGGGYPDFRDPEKSFQSMSQGMGMGIRPEETIVGASGGIGILIDQKGADRYHGDYFSQGSGYYFSLGLLYDNEGNDTYYAGRYAQGAGIHSAIGLLKDASGDDIYECTFGVSQGCGHDTGIGFLVDDCGNDTYRSETTSQGVGLEKGIGILADFQGNDTYDANDRSRGVSLPSQTEEVRGMGIFIDNQGGRDIFHDIIAENLLLYRSNGGLVLNR